MFCIHCGARLPDGARFCRDCGERVRDRLPAPPDPLVLSLSKDDAPPSSGAAGPDALAGKAHHDRNPGLLATEQLIQLPQWPERFVQEILTLVPALGPEKQLELERACRAHVDAILGTPAEIDLEALARRLEASSGSSAGGGSTGGSTPVAVEDPD